MSWWVRILLDFDLFSLLALGNVFLNSVGVKQALILLGVGILACGLNQPGVQALLASRSSWGTR